MASTLTTRRVWAKLWNENHSYDVQLSLEIRELRESGSPFPIDRTVSRITLLGGIAVQDGTYTLEYDFGGKQYKDTVRVSDGELLSV